MKARCGTSQVLAGLYCMLLQFGFFYSWHLFLEFRAGRTAMVLWITVGMFTRSWCHFVWSLVVTKWSTQTLLSQYSLDNKVSPQGWGLEALKCCCRCFHTFSHSNFPSSYTNTHTRRSHSCSIQSGVESYSIRTVMLLFWLDKDFHETTQNTL